MEASERKRPQLSGKVAGLLGGSAAGFGIGGFAGFALALVLYIVGGVWAPVLSFYSAVALAIAGAFVGYFYWVRMLARRK